MMHLRILLPTRVLIEDNSSKVIAEAENGSLCLKPRHVDMVTSLAAGILTWLDGDGQERFAGVAEGVLVKTGREVLVSVAFGVCGDDLERLRDAVRQYFEDVDERERQALSAVARLESDFVRRFLELESRAHV